MVTVNKHIGYAVVNATDTPYRTGGYQSSAKIYKHKGVAENVARKAATVTNPLRVVWIWFGDTALQFDDTPMPISVFLGEKKDE